MFLSHHLGILGLDPVTRSFNITGVAPAATITVRIFGFLQSFPRLFGEHDSLPKHHLKFLAQVQYPIISIGLWDPERFGDW
jgi:hypothetical protein